MTTKVKLKKLFPNPHNANTRLGLAKKLVSVERRGTDEIILEFEGDTPPPPGLVQAVVNWLTSEEWEQVED